MIKPKILVCSTPVYGHVMPLRAIARSLVQSGFSVTFLTGSDFQEAIKSIGATFVSLEGEADLTQAKVDVGYRNISKADPAGLQPSVDEEQQNYFVDAIVDQFKGVEQALETIDDGIENKEEAKIVIIVEGCFRGVLPRILGARGFKREVKVAGCIGIGIIPVALSSLDTAPFGPGILPDSSTTGRERNKKLHFEDQEVAFATSQRRFNAALKRLGARDTPFFIRDANYHLLDRFVQMCTPSFEYTRSDAPQTLIFAGGLPSGLRDPSPELPKWWEDITFKGDKKLIFVAQGTVSMNPYDLIIPTMLAFQNRDDILVVVALGKKGLSLPEGTLIPKNARVADFLPYDEILEFTDCFVSNGGYGAIQHGLSHGVPQLVAGEDADKAENCARVGWSGVGMNLRIAKPSVQQLQESVTSVLEDERYRRRAKEIQLEMLSYDPIKVVIEGIGNIANRT